MRNLIKALLRITLACVFISLKAQVSPSEKAALQDLYNATNGPNWDSETDSDLTNDWDFSGSVTSDWEGVSVANGHVTTLLLVDNNMVGTIPTSIGNLTFLQHLDLQSNELSGGIPDGIGNLSSLTTLSIGNNNISGSIPSTIGNMTALKSLYLYRNQLSGSIPSELQNLVNLNSMWLYDNSLSGTIPFEFGNLQNLWNLRLERNQLTGTIPAELSNIGGLNHIVLSSNQLSGSIPSEFGSLSNLFTLQLDNNNFTGQIPSELGGLSRLTMLWLHNNDFTGNIPTELGNLSNLRELYLYGNGLTGNIPSALGNLSNLQALSLSANQLNGSIPYQLGNLSNLSRLNLNNNHLTGSIPSEIGNLSNLTQIRLYSNQLTGSIPPELGNLSSLRYLFLYDNQLNGSIPSEIGNLSNLTQVTLYNNQLIGNIPPEIGNLVNLNSLSLYNNNLSGPIPNEISQLSNINSLNVRDNNFVFGDLEYTYNNSLDFSFYYYPQSKTDQIQSLQVEEGQSITLTTNVSGTQNHYEWFKDGQSIAGAPDSPNHVITDAESTDAGTYHCVITSDIITDLTLTRNDITLSVVPPTNNGNPGGPGAGEETGWNTITSWRLDLEGNIKSNARSYFNDLGKEVQRQSWDAATNTIWGQQTVYDYQGHPTLSSLSAPINGQTAFQYFDRFITNAIGNNYTAVDFDGTDKYNPSTVNADQPLGKYYLGETSDTYQDITAYPFTRTIFSSLNPGQPLAIIGGNKADTNYDGTISLVDQWPQSYSFTMPATNELSLDVAFDDANYINIQVLKTVTRDVHGVENVVFTDTEGKVLAAARSGPEGITSQDMNLVIGEQGYADVHIPQGITGISTSNDTAVSVYDLIADAPTMTPLGALSNGFYRVAVNDLDNYTPNTIFVRYKVNYYDYSLNEYDAADRLVKSYHPVTDSNGNKLVTTYEYNSLGQLVKTVSPDEGTAEFIYRDDGQIRFSRNSKQQYESTFTEEYSYTNYDALGRPVESGVVAWIAQPGNPNPPAFGSLDPDNDYILNNLFDDVKERQYTQYDYLEQDQLNFLGSLPGDYGNPTFLAGNVARTESDHATTYYSYDAYGRVKWLVQNTGGLGAKTIDYEYHPITGLVTRVIFQKGEAEQFIHRYAYNQRDQLTSVQTSIDDSSYTLQAQYFYDQAGTLVRTELANGAQGMDYVYNLAGQLKSINHPSLQAANDPKWDGSPGDTNDLFGMQLDYRVGDYQRTANANITQSTYGSDQLNGNIKGIRWNTDSSNNTGIINEYVYSYDRNNWLTSADYDPGSTAIGGGAPNELTLTGTITTNQTATQHITVTPTATISGTVTLAIDPNGGGLAAGDYDVSGITYDANGNLQSLVRNKGSQDGSNTMDNLGYSYDADKPNQLLQVTDTAGDVPNADDIGTQTDTENYVYNRIGQLVENKAENITYFYNASGLVTEVQQNNVPLVKFFYNDRNHRVKKESYSNGILSTTTFYVRDVAGQVMAIYSDYSGSMVVVERPIYGSGRIGVAYGTASNEGDYVYELTDHLGNVRAVFTKNSGVPNLQGYADYYPFGMAMPGRRMQDANQYRYTFQGQEKDAETGMEAFQLRLWDARIGRWLTTDPYRQFTSPYLGMGNNPMNGIDPDGGCWDDDGNWNSDCIPQPLDEVIVVGNGKGSWNTEGLYWSTTFAGNLNDWNALNGTNFSNSRDAFDWYKQQEWNAISAQHKAEFFAAREEYGRGVIQLMSVLTLPVSFAELGTAAVIYSGSRTALSFSDDIALLSDDIIQYSTTSIPRAPKGGIVIGDTFFKGGQFIPGARTTLNFGRQTQNFSSLPFGASTLRPAVHATLSTPALNGATGVGLSSLSWIRYYHRINQGN